MSEFDIKAGEWDKNRMYHERAAAVTAAIIRKIPLNANTSVLEYGAGTGLLSFMLKDHAGTITMADNSEGMVRVLREKTEKYGSPSMKVLKTDLEKDEYTGEKFDLICSLMVLHHVNDVGLIIGKFCEMLRPGGHIAVADLYSEDGSFHGEGFSGHMGFDPAELAALLEKKGFSNAEYETVYTIDKLTSQSGRKQFGVFLMTALRK